MTIDELIAKISNPENIQWGNQYRLNDRIATLLWGEPKISGGGLTAKRLHWWHDGLGREIAPDFLGSLDAAITVYLTRPEKIPINPRDVCLEALWQRRAKGE